MYLIGIAGPSGAGKTALARAVAARLEAPIVSLDSYYHDLAHLPMEERARVNVDIPDALDHELLVEHLRALAGGGEADVPVYDFSQHCRTRETVQLGASDFGVIEGLWTLYWEDVRRLLGTRVYIDTEDPVCFRRRLERDVRERGRSAQSVAEQYAETVRPMANRYVAPTQEFADLVLCGVESLDMLAGRVVAHALRSRK